MTGVISEPKRKKRPNSGRLPAGAIDLTNCDRQVLGFMVAAVVPGFLFGWAVAVPEFLSSRSPEAGLLVALPLWTALSGLFVTVPTVLLIGVPTYLVFTRHGWTDWPRCLLGAASVLMLWSMIYTRRALVLFPGLLLLCPIVAWGLS